MERLKARAKSRTSRWLLAILGVIWFLVAGSAEHSFFAWINEQYNPIKVVMYRIETSVKWAASNPLLFALILGVSYCLFVILWAQFSSTEKRRLEIVSVWNDDQVAYQQELFGVLSDSKAPIELRVYAGKMWHRQWPVKVQGNRWRAKCQFGDAESPAGSSYRVVAIVPNRSLDDKIPELPSDAVKSETISVVRSTPAMPEKTPRAPLPPATVSTSHLRLGTPMGANIHPIGGGQSAMVIKVANTEAGFEYTVHNIRAELIFTYLQTKETFRSQGLFATLGNNAIATEPVATISLNMSQSCELLVLAKRLNGHYSLSQWPFNPAREKSLRYGDWRIDIDVQSDSATDRVQYHAIVQLRSDGSSAWSLV